MPRLRLNSEARNMNGAIKQCQRPSQKPATPSWSMGVPLDWLAVGAHPATMISNSRTITRQGKEGFMAIPPVRRITKGGHEKSHQDGRGGAKASAEAGSTHSAEPGRDKSSYKLRCLPPALCKGRATCGVRGGARRIWTTRGPLGDLWWQSRVTI